MISKEFRNHLDFNVLIENTYYTCNISCISCTFISYTSWQRSFIISIICDTFSGRFINYPFCLPQIALLNHKILFMAQRHIVFPSFVRHRPLAHSNPPPLHSIPFWPSASNQPIIHLFNNFNNFSYTRECGTNEQSKAAQ